MTTPKIAPQGAQVITLPVALKYIGHSALEDMLAEYHPSTRPTIRIIDLVSQAPAGIQGMRRHEVKILVQIADIDTVHYCAIVTGAYVTMNGNTFGPADNEAKARSASNQDAAHKIIKDWILSLGYNDIRSGLIAMPTEYQVLTGWASCITQHKEHTGPSESYITLVPTDPAPVVQWIEAQGTDDDGFISVDDMAKRLGLRRRDTAGGVEYSGQNPFDPDGDQFGGFILYGAGTDKPGWAYDSKLKYEYDPQELAERAGVSKVAYTVPLIHDPDQAQQPQD